MDNNISVVELRNPTCINQLTYQLIRMPVFRRRLLFMQIQLVSHQLLEVFAMCAVAAVRVLCAVRRS